jgi:hypothetical protein
MRWRTSPVVPHIFPAGLRTSTVAGPVDYRRARSWMPSVAMDRPQGASAETCRAAWLMSPGVRPGSSRRHRPSMNSASQKLAVPSSDVSGFFHRRAMIHEGCGQPRPARPPRGSAEDRRARSCSVQAVPRACSENRDHPGPGRLTEKPAPAYSPANKTHQHRWKVSEANCKKPQPTSAGADPPRSTHRLRGPMRPTAFGLHVSTRASGFVRPGLRRRRVPLRPVGSVVNVNSSGWKWSGRLSGAGFVAGVDMNDSTSQPPGGGQR